MPGEIHALSAAMLAQFKHALAEGSTISEVSRFDPHDAEAQLRLNAFVPDAIDPISKGLVVKASPVTEDFEGHVL